MVRLNDRPDMALDVYRGRKTTTQQLVMCFTSLLANTLKFFVEKNERSFCSAKASQIFSTKILEYLRY